MEHYKIITITHKTTHVSSLKDYLVQATDEGDYPASRLSIIKEKLKINELLYLNTCNRVTFFFTSDEKLDAAFLVKFMKEINPAFDELLLQKHLDKTMSYEGMEAIRHLFGVAASLDSLVLGEREIMGQLKLAYQNARNFGLCGDNLRLAMESCIVFAKKIYSDTRIGDKPVSVVSLAFRELMARGVAPETHLFIIGAGQTNNLVANLLEKYGFSKVTVFNRTISKAEELAARFSQGKAMHLSALSHHDEKPGLIITCTGAHDYVIGTEHFQNWDIHPKVPFTVVDLAVPADLDPEVRNQYAIDYIDVASLKELAEMNKEFRRNELVKAYQILDEFLVSFEHKFRERKLELALMDIPVQVKALKQKAVSEVFRKEMDQLDDNAKEILHKMMDYMEKKYISIPITAAKKTLLQDEASAD